jgi:hypothetical protein
MSVIFFDSLLFVASDQCFGLFRMAHDALRATLDRSAIAVSPPSTAKPQLSSPPVIVHVTYNKAMQYVHRYFSFTFAALSSATFIALEKTVGQCFVCCCWFDVTFVM